VNPYVNIEEPNNKSRGVSMEESRGESMVAATRFSIDFDKLSPLTISNKNIYFGSSNDNGMKKDDDVFEKSKESNLKPELPVKLTHYEDFDDEDDDSDELLSQGSQILNSNKQINV